MTEPLRQRNLRLSDDLVDRVDKLRGPISREAYLRVIIERHVAFYEGDSDWNVTTFMENKEIDGGWRTMGELIDEVRGSVPRFRFVADMLIPLTVRAVSSARPAGASDGKPDPDPRLVAVWRDWERSYVEPIGGWDGVEQFHEWFIRDRDAMANRVATSTPATLADDAAALQRWLGAGADLRVAVRGVDNIAEARARMLANLDALQASLRRRSKRPARRRRSTEP